MNRTTLFVLSCISLLTTSMMFIITSGLQEPMTTAFKITKEQTGYIWGSSFQGFTIAIFICGLLVDLVGMKTIHILSALGYIVGVTLVLVAPAPTAQVEHIFENTGTMMLYAGFLLMGLSQGMVEGVINPLVATIHSDDKVHKLNVLHAWWPGGMIVGGLAVLAMENGGVTDWKMKLSLLYVPAAIYLVGAMMQKYPKTERVASGVSTSTMMSEVLRPLFLVLVLCMWLTASTELGPNKWFPSVMDALTNLKGIWFLIYTAGLMFVLRSFAGPIAHKISPPALLIGCSVLSALGLFWLGSLKPGTAAPVAFAAATVFGIGTTFFWPTMLGVTSEQFPRGGSLLMNIMGGMGMLAISFALPLIGAQFDAKGAGPALQYVAILPVILVFIFGMIFMYFKSRGGYRPVKIEVR